MFTATPIMSPFGTVGGMEVFTSVFIGDPVQEIQNRSWKERLFTWPWRPFKKTKTVTVYKPNGKILLLEKENKIMMHPADWEQMKTVLQEKYGS